jgi:transcriptional regulator with XRE-family HTH domain
VEDWATVAEVINARVNELGWRQGELAERSHVSRATVREIQHHIVERRRSARTLEALSTALGWPPQYLDAVLRGRRLPELPQPSNDNGESLRSRMDRFERHLSAITDRLDAIQADLTAVIDCVRKDR